MIDSFIKSEAWAVARRAALRVVKQVRCISSRHLKTLDPLIAVGNSYQMAGVEKLKKHLLKLVVKVGLYTNTQIINTAEQLPDTRREPDTGLG